MTFESIIENAPLIVKNKLEQLKFLQERPDYHPEPSTYHHIRIVTNRLIKKGYSMELILSGVLHDICKFDCVKQNLQTGYPTSPEHGKYAARLIEEDLNILTWLDSFNVDVCRIIDICGYHMRIQQYQFMKPNKKQQIEELDCFQDLLLFTACDDMLSEEYNLKDVLPIKISSIPIGGVIDYSAIFNDDTIVTINEYDYTRYIHTGRYKITNNLDNDVVTYSFNYIIN